MFFNKTDKPVTEFEQLPRETPQRLKSQFDFYDRGANRHLKKFQRCKLIQLVAGGAIPVASILIPTNSPNQILILRGVTASLAAIVGGVESYVQFRQFHQNWVRWRTAAEALRREASLFAQRAGAYKNAESPEILLAENVEDIIAVEQQSWRSLQDNPHPVREAKVTETAAHKTLAPPHM